MRILTTAIAALIIAFPAFAQDRITKISPHSVSETMNRLAAAVGGAGATIFARVDHAKGGASVDMDLRPTELLIFGNPKLGTPVMLADQEAGLDLPLRVLAYADAEGQVHLTYQDPASFTSDYAVTADTAPLAQIAGALDKLTDMAIADN